MKTKPAAAPHSGAAAPQSSSPHHRDRRRPASASASSSTNNASSNSSQQHQTGGGDSTSSSSAAAAAASAANDKENSHGKYAGISPESIRCTSEQFAVENLSDEACSALAEDLSYKLRQLIHNVALHARHAKTPRVEVDDVNCALRLMDTEPVLGAHHAQWTPIVDAETYKIPVDPEVNVVELGTRPLTVCAVPPPSLSCTWVSDVRNSPGKSLGISAILQNYYMKISRAFFSGDKKLIKVALRDLSTNTHIGPIIPNIINLSVSVLNEMSIITPISQEIIHRQALNILDCLLVNPCCCDTDVDDQLQRLFPILVTNVLTESIYTQQILRIIASVVVIWPQFAHIGRNSVIDYLSQGVEERLTGPLVECLTAMGRKALMDGLFNFMPLLDLMILPTNEKIFRPGLYEALLNASSVFLKVPNSRYDSKNAYVDECLYEILGDAVVARRIHRESSDRPSSHPPSPPPSSKLPELEAASPYSPLGPPKKRARAKLVKHFPTTTARHHLLKKSTSQQLQQQYYAQSQPPPVFEYHRDFASCPPAPGFIRLNIGGCRQVPRKFRWHQPVERYPTGNPTVPNGGQSFNGGNRKAFGVTVASGLLLRFKYKLPADKGKRKCPDYGLYML